MILFYFATNPTISMLFLEISTNKPTATRHILEQDDGGKIITLI